MTNKMTMMALVACLALMGTGFVILGVSYHDVLAEVIGRGLLFILVIVFFAGIVVITFGE